MGIIMVSTTAAVAAVAMLNSSQQGSLTPEGLLAITLLGVVICAVLYLVLKDPDK